MVALISGIKVQMVDDGGLGGLELHTALLSYESYSGIDVAVSSNDEVVACIDEIDESSLID